MEFLAPRVTRKIEIIRDSLEGRLEVVLTGRDLARNIAAMWLESVQNGSAVTWDDYLGAVRVRGQPVTRSPATSGTTRAWPRSRAAGATRSAPTTSR